MQVSSALAGRQKGIVSRAQLLSAPIPSGVITRLIRAGFLHPLHRGVYAVGHTALPQFAREQAALLACGKGAVISGRSALHLWGIVQTQPPAVEISVAARHCRKRPGIQLHLLEAIDGRELRTRHALPVVFPARALIEFAAAAGAAELADAVAEARLKGLVRDEELEDAAWASGRRRGGPQMRAFLRDEGGPAITRSRAERQFRRLLGDAQLPQPTANAAVAGLEVDFLWEAEKVVLEVDGWRFHRHRRAFEEDRRRDRILSDAGYHVIRITVRQISEEPLAMIAHIARMLDRRGRGPH